MSDKYFLSATIVGEKFEKEVTIEEFCKAERSAGFRPKLSSDHPDYMTTPATGGFGSNGINGTVRSVDEPESENELNFVWEDPESDPNAAIREIQVALDKILMKLKMY